MNKTPEAGKHRQSKTTIEYVLTPDAPHLATSPPKAAIVQNTDNSPQHTLKQSGQRGCRMYKQAVIHYPKDERMMKQIHMEIARLHCAAAVKYLDMLQLDCQQKVTVIDALLHDLQQGAPSNISASN